MTVAGLASGLLLAAAMQLKGPVGALLPAAAVCGLLILRNPLWALALLLFSTIAIEAHDAGILPPVGAYYDTVGAKLSIPDLLLFSGLAGVLLTSLREGRRPRRPTPLGVPLLLLTAALAAGLVTGHFAVPSVSKGELFHRGMEVVYIVLVPLLVVNVIRDARALKACAAVVAGLAAYKGLSGLYGALSGVGAAANETTISYLDPLANLVMLGFLLGILAAAIGRVKLPGWMYAGAPLALFALLLSYRRSFWMAAVFALIVVAVLASRRRGRAVGALAAVALALTLIGTFTIGSSQTSSSSPLLERAGQLSPTGVEEDKGDRYRVDERRNVLADLGEHPLTGLGIGVPWAIHYPTAEAHDRRYVHVGLLFFWMSFGPLGLIAYLAVFGTGAWAALAVWRRHPDRYVKVTALACFGALAGLAIVELTASFAAVDIRISLLLGGMLGWIAAAWQDARDSEPAAPA